MRKSLFYTTFLIEMPGSEPGSTWFRKVSFSKLLFSLGDSHQASLVPNLVPVGSAKSYCEAACGNVGLVSEFSSISLGSAKSYCETACGNETAHVDLLVVGATQFRGLPLPRFRCGKPSDSRPRSTEAQDNQAVTVSFLAISVHDLEAFCSASAAWLCCACSRVHKAPSDSQGKTA